MIVLFVTGFGRADLLREQVRLLDKHLDDAYSLCVIDNTAGLRSPLMEMTARRLGIDYMRSNSPKHLHNDALNMASRHACFQRFDHWGVIDHDIFPVRQTTLIDKIDAAGFFGLGQTHTATGARYLWPGFAFFSRSWLDGRVPNFDGIRGDTKADDGDCGSMLHTLFVDGDLDSMAPLEHGYGVLRDPERYGINLQSHGFEIVGDWVHATNASHWLTVPDPEGRDRLISDMLAAL